MKKALIVVTTLFLAACGSLPERDVTRTDDRSYLSFSPKRPSATLYLNSHAIEIPDALNSDNKLSITPGTHKVRVVQDGETIYQRELFVADGSTRQIVLNVAEETSSTRPNVRDR